jgi:hypothetical protein
LKKLLKIVLLIGMINLVLCGIVLVMIWKYLTKNMIINLASYWLIATTINSIILYEKEEEK